MLCGRADCYFPGMDACDEACLAARFGSWPERGARNRGRQSQGIQRSSDRDRRDWRCNLLQARRRGRGYRGARQRSSAHRIREHRVREDYRLLRQRDLGPRPSRPQLRLELGELLRRVAANRCKDAGLCSTRRTLSGRYATALVWRRTCPQAFVRASVNVYLEPHDGHAEARLTDGADMTMYRSRREAGRFCARLSVRGGRSKWVGNA